MSPLSSAWPLRVVPQNGQCKPVSQCSQQRGYQLRSVGSTQYNTAAVAGEATAAVTIMPRNQRSLAIGGTTRLSGAHGSPPQLLAHQTQPRGNSEARLLDPLACRPHAN